MAYEIKTFTTDKIVDLKTQKANVDEVNAALALKAPLNSPVFTGTPSAPTAASGTNTTQLATTAFVEDAVTASASILAKFAMLQQFAAAHG